MKRLMVLCAFGWVEQVALLHVRIIAQRESLILCLMRLMPWEEKTGVITLRLRLLSIAVRA